MTPSASASVAPAASSPAPADYDEPARRLPILDEADVLVIGGGPGGIGAAVAAARNGARTILLERFGSFGGTWTAGLLSAIMPFPFVKGIFAEVLAGLQADSGWSYWGGDSTYGNDGTYEIESAKVALDRLVVQAGVIPYFFTQFADVIREGDRLVGVIVETKEGRAVIRAKQIIDSSGDGDVCVRAGVPFSQAREKDGAVQPMTMIFTMSGVDDARVIEFRKKDWSYAKLWQAAKARGEATIPREDVLTSTNPRAGV